MCCRTRRGAFSTVLRVGAALAGLLLCLVGFTPARAEPASTGDRVVHGRIGTPTGQQFAMRTASGNPTVDGVLGSVPPRTYAGCVAEGIGIDDTRWVIDDVVPGRVFELTADAGSWNDDFDIAFYEALTPCDGTTPPAGLPHRNRAGDEAAVVPMDARVAVVILVTGSPAAAFTYRELGDSKVRFKAATPRPTVVAVMEPAATALEVNGFSPYHVDFLGAHHPWNKDTNLENDLDFTSDPAAYIPGYPTDVPAVGLHLPQGEGEAVKPLMAADAATWGGLRTSTATQANLYRLAGTKVVGAIRFTRTPGTGGVLNGFQTNEIHATRSASVAAGNRYGTCPTCVFVWVLFEAGDQAAAIQWVANQPWIDVVTNSWVNPSYPPSGSDPAIQRQAVERGQTWVWSAGNGYDGVMLVPNSTHSWRDHAADWTVLVGGVASGGRQRNGGAPVDIVSYADSYPSAGGPVADGESRHSGTSNAAPVVAGTLAATVQLGRDLLGDVTTVPDNGVLAVGKPQPCTAGVPVCPLMDGRLTRAEAQTVVFENVVPAPTRPTEPPSSFVATALLSQATPPTVLPSVSQGHGVVHGHLDPPAFVAEQRRFLDALRGAVGPRTRPPAERNWMTADSKCRQRLWGAWSGGYYTGVEPTYDPLVDQVAMAWDAACTPLPTGVLGRAFEDICTPTGNPVCVVWPLR